MIIDFKDIDQFAADAGSSCGNNALPLGTFCGVKIRDISGWDKRRHQSIVLINKKKRNTGAVAGHAFDERELHGQVLVILSLLFGEHASSLTRIRPQRKKSSQSDL
jgi:hypothetical protein